MPATNVVTVVLPLVPVTATIVARAAASQLHLAHQPDPGPRPKTPCPAGIPGVTTISSTSAARATSRARSGAATSSIRARPPLPGSLTTVVVGGHDLEPFGHQVPGGGLPAHTEAVDEHPTLTGR